MADATVIDSLIVTLGLDPSDYSKGRKAAAADLLKFRTNAQDTAKELQEQGKKGAEFFSTIKKEALGLFAVVVGAGGLEKWAASTVTSLAATGRAAQLAGVNVSGLAAFQQYIVRSGGSAELATASIQGLAQAMEEWRVTGNTAMLPALNRIGASANEDAFGTYRKYAEWAAKQKDATYVAFEGHALGLDEVSIAQALKGGAGFDAGMAQSYKNGVPTDADIKNITKLQASFLEMRQAITQDGQALLEDLAPGLTTVLDCVTKGLTAFPEITKDVLALVAAFTALKTFTTAGAVLRLLSGGGAAAAGGGAASAGGGALGAGALTVGGVVAPAAAFAYELLHPTQANVGEAAALANARAKSGMGAFGAHGGTDTTEGRKAYLLALLKSKGVPDDVAMGIVAGMYAESKLNPNAKGPVIPSTGHRAFGIEQLLGPRMKAFKAKYGNNTSFEQQADFFISELFGGDPGGAAVLGTHNAKDALFAYSDKFMRAKGGVAGDVQRGTRWLNSQGGGGGGKTVNITGPITVNTQATDAKGIAKAFSSEVARQANTGLE